MPVSNKPRSTRRSVTRDARLGHGRLSGTPREGHPAGSKIVRKALLGHTKSTVMEAFIQMGKNKHSKLP